MEKFKEIWNIYRRRPIGMIGLIALIFVVAVAIFAPLLAPYDTDEIIDVQPEDLLTPPDEKHLLGTDHVGEDVLSKLIFGARISLIVGFVASMMSVVIGSTVGLVSGYYSGWIGNVLMRLVDFLMVIPVLPLMMVIIFIWGRGFWKIIIVIGTLSWPMTARLVRSQVISIKERKFVMRAHAIGVSNVGIIARHILPQVFPIIIAESIILIAGAIIAESTLAFLGLGDPLAVSWGSMLNFAFAHGISRMAWWFLLPPGLGIVWVCLSVVYIGNTLEEIINPTIKTHHLFNPRRMISMLVGGIPKTKNEKSPNLKTEKEEISK